MNILQRIAENKIAEAIAEGRLQCGVWRGKPLPADDDPFMPEDMKMAYKILKNAGYVPPEVEVRREIGQLEELIYASSDEHTRLRQMKKLEVLLRKLDLMRPGGGNIAGQEEYYRRVVERITVHADKKNGK